VAISNYKILLTRILAMISDNKKNYYENICHDLTSSTYSYHLPNFFIVNKLSNLVSMHNFLQRLDNESGWPHLFSTNVVLKLYQPKRPLTNLTLSWPLINTQKALRSQVSTRWILYSPNDCLSLLHVWNNFIMQWMIEFWYQIKIHTKLENKDPNSSTSTWGNSLTLSQYFCWNMWHL